MTTDFETHPVGTVERLTAENEKLRAVAEAAEAWRKKLGPIDGTMPAWIELGALLTAWRNHSSTEG